MGNTEGRPDPAAGDREWGGYHPRAAVPAVLGAAAAAAGLVAGRWAVRDLSEFADRGGALAVYGLVLAVVAASLAAAVYRVVTHTYRLTGRAVLVDRGPWWPPEPPVPLGEVTAVEVRAGWLARRLGVGRVVVQAAGRAVSLSGVRHPGAFAATIRAAAEERRRGEGGRP